MSYRRIVFFQSSLLLLCLGGCGRADSPTGKWRPKDFYVDKDAIVLLDAVGRGDTKEIHRLVSKGVNVNVVGKQGMTPLLWAMWSHNKPAFETLLDLGADPNLQMDKGDSVMSFACVTPQDTYWLELVLKHGGKPDLVNTNSGTTPIFDAVSSRVPKNLELIIKAGADVNHQDNDGDPPILHAAMLNWFDSVLVLLDAGADYRVRDKSGLDLVYLCVNASIDPEFPK